MKSKLFLIFILITSYSFSQKVKNVPFSPPIIKGTTVTENYWGTKIEDPYRNLENLEDTLVQNWLKANSTYADTLLNKISGRDSLISQFKKFSKRKSFRIKNLEIIENDTHFYLKRNKGERAYKLYYKQSNNDQEELLYNPENFNPNSENKYEINYIKPSWDGKYIVVSMSYSGKELSEMIIIDIQNRKVLPEIITNSWPKSFLGINWLPDSNSFTYLHFPIDDPSHKEFKKNTQTVLYKIGQDPQKLNVIFNIENNSELEIKGHPATMIKSKNDKYIVGYMIGVDNYWDAYYTEIENLNNKEILWKRLYSKADKVYKYSGTFVNDNFIFISSNNASNFKIASTKISSLNFESPNILVDEKPNEIIDDFIINSNGLFYVTLKNGVEAKLYTKNQSDEKQIILPKVSGNIDLDYKNLISPEVWVTIKGWTNGSELYEYNLETNTFKKEKVYPEGDYLEFNDLVVEEIVIPSHDGAEVPLSIVRLKNFKKNGKNPIIIDTYGFYGDILNPYFSTIMLSWVLEGGIYCTAHVRGGGEKGDAWHKAGQKTTKPNTWKDLIACTEYLINEKYTSKKYTAIYSSSAGGITVGRAITERPELFAVAIADVAMMNPLRSEARKGGGGSNYKEYGTIKDSLECMSLIAMDPYLNIKKDAKYPAMYLTAGMNDPRVPAWMPGKFVARMQDTKTKKPIIFDVDFNAGHSGSSSTKEKWANIFAFSLWQMGHPDYQLKE